MDLRRSEGDPLAPPLEAVRLERPPKSWSIGRLSAAALVSFALAAWLAAASTGYLQQRKLARRAVEHSEQLLVAYDGLNRRSETLVAEMQAEIADLEANDAEQEAAIDALREMKDHMATRLAAGERRLRNVTDERDRALRTVQDFKETIQAHDIQSASLADELAHTQARLIEVSDQRDVSQRTEAGLRWRLASIQSQLERMGARQAFTQSWLEGWVLGNLETLEELVAGTGVDVELLVARAASSAVGQGGPFEAVVDQPPDDLPIAASVTEDILRLSALQKLTSSLPLASPLDQFHITSAFGKRQDPFAKGWAFHGGLDLGAPAGSKVLATAPGTVTVAGRTGPYGNMVEIDHGMGVITRYGHLKSVTVGVGDHVGFRQDIGVIGSTGRSTSLHLHYEIRVDGAPHDPSRFLDAGRYLVAIFDLGEQASQQAGSGG